MALYRLGARSVVTAIHAIHSPVTLVTMPELSPTTGTLRKAGRILDAEIEAAVDVALLNPDIRTYPLGGGFFINIAATVRADPTAALILARPGASKADVRREIRTAIMMARPLRAA